MGVNQENHSSRTLLSFASLFNARCEPSLTMSWPPLPEQHTTRFHSPPTRGIKSRSVPLCTANSSPRTWPHPFGGGPSLFLFSQHRLTPSWARSVRAVTTEPSWLAGTALPRTGAAQRATRHANRYFAERSPSLSLPPDLELCQADSQFYESGEGAGGWASSPPAPPSHAPLSRSPRPRPSRVSPHIGRLGGTRRAHSEGSPAA